MPVQGTAPDICLRRESFVYCHFASGLTKWPFPGAERIDSQRFYSSGQQGGAGLDIKAQSRDRLCE